MNAALWIGIGVILLAVLTAGKEKKSKPSASQTRPLRIDHPHILSEDESECSVCGKRFRGRSEVCPSCGARFAGSREDREELDEEEDELDAWDEEEGL